MSQIVHTGRTQGRNHRPGYCQGCGQRILLGDPKPTSTWPGRLRLEREQWELLLVAAAEYAQLTDEAGEYESAVAFVDWVGVDALRGQNSTVVEADGAPPRNNAGGLATRGDISAHRHPDPIPVVKVAVWRRQAG